MTQLENLAINTIRLLSADAVQKANSGHPGLPMGAASMAFTLWTRYLNFDPKNPQWANRDRFILSAGHGSMLLYSLLYLTGYNVSLEDLKQFRQLDSKTAGHPEYGLADGIETTTGPLGQGFANGVGMAVAQKYLASHYNQPGFDVFDYNIYAICSDGDLMEGISSESASFAGHLKLGNIIYLYDDNHISIEGKTEITFTDDTAKRFESFGWHVQSVEDGNDVEEISLAIQKAKDERHKPSLIKVRTHIAYGSPNKVDSASAHGSPLGDEELRLTKINLGFDPDKSFFVPEEVLKYFREIGENGNKKFRDWEKLYSEYKGKHPDSSRGFEMLMKGEFEKGWKESIPVFDAAEKEMATRSASGKTINAIAKYFPTLIGGSADLAPSNDTHLTGYEDFSPEDYNGRNFHFGVREHSMGAELNGMALTKPIIPYGGTFLIFSDYMRPAIRLAAIMKIRPIFIFTHDSIGLGEDGTTHQPIEQLMSLRLIPDLIVIRPADANETAQAWRVALEHKKGPVAIVLTRQKLPVIDQKKYSSAKNLEKGAYVLSDCKGKPDVIFIATGSEVQLAIAAQEKLFTDKINTRVVSMPSWELFEMQSKEYKESVLPAEIRKRISIEAGVTSGWEKYVTESGKAIGINEFGKSAPGNILMKEYGFSPENVIRKAKEIV